MSKPNDPSDCVEFINEDGTRYAWSESHCRYELVGGKGHEGESFKMLRDRLDRCRSNYTAVNEALEYARQWMITHNALATDLDVIVSAQSGDAGDSYAEQMKTLTIERDDFERQVDGLLEEIRTKDGIIERERTAMQTMAGLINELRAHIRGLESLGAFQWGTDLDAQTRKKRLLGE